MIASREFTLPNDHPALSGHFPSHPVVPGVILLSWCELLASELAGRPIAVSSWINVKFVQPLKPEQTCNITLTSNRAGEAAFRIARDSLLIASGRFEWLLATG